MPDLSRLRDIWRGLELPGQVTLVASIVAVLVTAGFLFRFAARPAYTTLVSRVDPAESADVTSALEGAGIAYKLAGRGTEIAVTQGDVATARVALAKQRLPRGGHVGYEIFDKKRRGAPDFQQKVDFQRALEGEVARTIEQIDGVRSAGVQLVLPDETLFADDGAKASAAVLLTANELDSATVRGIAHLVASSVKGLDASAVTITDATGKLLWPSSDGDTGGDGLTASSRLHAEQLYASRVTSDINALLASTLGPGKAVARVHASLSLDQTSIDKVIYGKKGTELQTQSDEETLGSKGSAAGATPAGTGSNVPSYGGGASTTGGKSDYKHKTESKTFGVDKTIERTTVAPGAVKRLDVALMVDDSIPLKQVDALKGAVAAAAGIDKTRGDTFSVSTMKFAQADASTATPKAGGPLAALGSPIAIAKDVGMGLAALVFLFLVRRGLKRREHEGVAPEPTWLREFESVVPIAQLEAGPHVPAVRHELDPAAEQRNQLRDELEEIAKNSPEQVALQVNQWMKQ